MSEWTIGQMNVANADNDSVHSNHCRTDYSLNIVYRGVHKPSSELAWASLLLGKHLPST